MFFIPQKASKAIYALILVFLIFGSISIPTHYARAQNVPIGTDFDFNNIMAHLKDFVLDHLASLVAKQILHQMTVSVVNWINTGFQGSPSFLTNPQGFFLDAADQVTGAFIAQTGVLSGLCSPFSLDIRLNLALNQTQLINQRYACTLSTVINNAQNAHANVSVGSSPNGATLGDMMNGNVLHNSNQLSVNGNSIDQTAAFMSGDFTAGGWAGFLALTTEPQNNMYGAYLQARSDLAQQIAARQTAINNDLNRGHGFMSWQKCNVIGTADINSSQQQIDELDAQTANDPTVNVITNKDGSMTYQSCTTQTPGSVLAGTLQKNVDSSATQLELANDINAVVDALVSQMVNQMLTAGLGALSSASGGRLSYTAQIQAEQSQIYNQQIGQAQLQASASLGQSETAVHQYKDAYDQAVTAITDSKNNYLTAKSCFANKVAAVVPPATLSPSETAYAQTAMSNIGQAISANVDPLLSSLTSKQSAAASQLTSLQNYQNLTSANLSTTADLQAQSQTYQDAVKASATINANAQNNLASAQTDLANAQKQSQTFNADAARFQSACDLFPNIGLGAFNL